MVQKPDDGGWLKDGELDSGDGLGDDWESAFQAGEFEFSPDDKNELFSAGSGAGTPYVFTPPDPQELTNLPDLEADPPTAVGTTPAGPAADSSGQRWRQLRHRFSALPLIHRLVLCGGPVLTLILALSLTPLMWRPLDQSVPETDLPAAAPPHPAAEAPVTVARAEPEPILQRWKFDAFLLPVSTAEPAGKTIFLEIDLTLVLVLGPEEELPQAQKIFIRDLIYQFYRQQSHETLRHFSLARGEMSRALLSWLRDKWPDSPVETIFYNRYQFK